MSEVGTYPLRGCSIYAPTASHAGLLALYSTLDSRSEPSSRVRLQPDSRQSSAKLTVPFILAAQGFSVEPTARVDVGRNPLRFALLGGVSSTRAEIEVRLAGSPADTPYPILLGLLTELARCFEWHRSLPEGMPTAFHYFETGGRASSNPHIYTKH